MQYFQLKRSIKTLIFLLSLLCSLTIHAQTTRVITGQVRDADDNMPIPGVNVVVKGTSIGTVTNFEGNFKLSTTETVSELEFSYVGYKKTIVAVDNSNKVSISLKPDLEQLEEVVVVGYGQMKKSDLTGSVVSVEGEALQNTISTSMDQALVGRAAGVVVTQNSGAPGGGVSINIRGTSSFSNTEPLYVVDGVPISGDSRGTSAGFGWAGGGDGQTAVNALSAINTNDIESIEILKDASATAIYGSRAANGVVLVTTKSGKSGKTNISYDTYYALQEVPKKLDVLNLREFASFMTEIDEDYGRESDPRFLDPSLLGEGTDWQNEVFQVAPMYSHNLSVSGGNDKTTFVTSLGYLDQEGIIIESGFEKLTGRLSLNHKATDWLKLGASVNFGNTTEQIQLSDDIDGVVSLALRSRPDIPVRNVDGSYGGPGQETGITFLTPVAQAQLRDMTLERMRVFGNLNADINLHKNLKFTTKLGYDFGVTNNYGFDPTYEVGQVVNNQNKSRRQVDQNRYWILSNYLTYTKNFSDKLKMSVMLGQEAQESSWQGIMAQRYDFISNDVPEINAGNAETALNSGYKGSHALASYFGRGHFDLFDKYMLTATFRYDGSSNFGSNNKWGLFPSFAFAWKMKNEDFMKGIDKISDLKLRLGYGEVGNQDIGNYGYGVALTNHLTKWGNGLLPTNYANPNLMWESSKSTNIGIDLAMFENRVELIAEAYQINTEGLLMELPLPMYMGATGTGSIRSPYSNVGEMSNRGVELTLNTVNTTGAVKWSSGITVTVNRNNVESTRGEPLDSKVQYGTVLVTRTSEGNPAGLFYGYQTDGIFQTLEDVASSALPVESSINRDNGTWVGDVKFKDLNGDGVIDEGDLSVIGDPNPDFTFGFNNTVSWKNFDFNMMITGSVGGEALNFTRRELENMNGNTNQFGTVKDRARINEDGTALINPGATVPRASVSTTNGNNRISDRFIEDASYVRIQNLSIGYSLPNHLLEKLHLTKLRMYVNFQNLYTFTNYSGFDPEIGKYNQNALLLNVDNGKYPTPRVYTMGLNVNF